MFLQDCYCVTRVLRNNSPAEMCYVLLLGLLLTESRFTLKRIRSAKDRNFRKFKKDIDTIFLDVFRVFV